MRYRKWETDTGVKVRHRTKSETQAVEEWELE